MKKNYRNLTKLLNKSTGYFKRSSTIADIEKLTPFVSRVKKDKSTFENHYMTLKEAKAKGFTQKEWDNAREYFVKEVMGNKSGRVKLTQANVNRLEKKAREIHKNKINEQYEKKAKDKRIYDVDYWEVREKLTPQEWSKLKELRRTGVDFYGSYDIIWGMHIGDKETLRKLSYGTETDKLIKQYIETDNTEQPEIKEETKSKEKDSKIIEMRKGVRK